jgi:hypothetical protein
VTSKKAFIGDSNWFKKGRFTLPKALVLGILLLCGFRSAAQDEHALHEVYQAQAMGQNTQVGQTFNVTVHIDEYSTPEERQILVEAFNSGGSKGLYNGRRGDISQLLAPWVTTSSLLESFQWKRVSNSLL